MNKGVFQAVKKDGSIYYRASFTFRSKHISLGSYPLETEASIAYEEAFMLSKSTLGIEDYIPALHHLAFGKWVSIINLRDNGFYFKTPIYLKPKYFEYYYSPDFVLKFDVDDLFFYSTHTIMKRGGHLFVSDYGMQLNILNRYGIKNHGVAGKDYRFVNGDPTDFRYKNIDIINRYAGVTRITEHGRTHFLTKIHINGDFIIGRFRDEATAAIAYNKTVDYLTPLLPIRYEKNYIDGLSSEEYKKRYEKITIPKKILSYPSTLS